MYEYKVVEGPSRSVKSWLKGGGYAEALSEAINEQALNDWEYQGSEPGLGKDHLIVFRRHVKRLEDHQPDVSPNRIETREPKRAPITPMPARKIKIEDKKLLQKLRGGQSRKVGATSKDGGARDSDIITMETPSTPAE